MHYRANGFLYTVLSALLAISFQYDASAASFVNSTSPLFGISKECRTNLPYVDSDCLPIMGQFLGLLISTVVSYKLYNVHHKENEWDAIGIGYKTFGASSAIFAKELWDQVNKCITTAILVSINTRCSSS